MTQHTPAHAPEAQGFPENEKLPFLSTLGFGLQHTVAMFGGIIAVPLLIGGAAGLSGAEQALLISCAIFISGLATMLQSAGLPLFGSRLPVVQGISFVSIGTVVPIVAKATDGHTGLRIALGSTIAAGVVALALVPVFAQIIRFFPPVVTGSIITVIGMSLLSAAGGWITGSKMIKNAAGESIPNPGYAQPKAIILSISVLLVILLLTRIKAVSRLAILVGLLIGTAVAIPLGMANPFLPAGSDGRFGLGDIVGLPQPLAFGLSFEIGAFVSMLIVCIVIMVETTADIVAVGQIIQTETTTKRVANGLRADMLWSVVGPVLNVFPVSAFAQNVGLVALSRVRSRWVVATSGAILTVLGLSPVLAAVIKVIPNPVLGGAGILLFGTVAAAGIRSLAQVRYQGTQNLVIVAVAVSFGLLPKVSPDIWSGFPGWFQAVFNSGISACTVVAVLLNVLFNMTGSSEEEAEAVA